MSGRRTRFKPADDETTAKTIMVNARLINLDRAFCRSSATSAVHAPRSPMFRKEIAQQCRKRPSLQIGPESVGQRSSSKGRGGERAILP